jgi:signal transduction histidine kinase
MEYRLRRHDGRYRWILDNGVPRFNLDGSFAGYIGSCVDITDSKEVDAIRSAFSRRLIRAQEAERAAVGRELHDDINQRVALAMLNLESLKGNLHRISDVKQELGTVIEQLDEISVDIQTLSHRLHSSKLEQLGLRAAAEGFCREVATMHKVDVEFHSDDLPRDLRRETALCLFRILQEAVQNSTKHSGTTHLQVSLTGGRDEIVLTVSDAGVGFDPARAAKGRGIGLASMRERLRLVRGQLSIESRPGQGTVMRARVPLGPTAKPAQQV